MKTNEYPVKFASNNFLSKSDTAAVLFFLNNEIISLSFDKRLEIVNKLLEISNNIDCPHTHEEILSYVQTILELPTGIMGCVVEAGCYKGGSSSKFSHATQIVGRELIIFDSFEGIPGHSEPHKLNIYGKPVTFDKGEYFGSLHEVKNNISRYGCIENCKFIKGWFEDTLPHFNKTIAAIYIDVDLASSVKTCLKYLYPLLVDGGVLYCQDGHLPLVIDVFTDDIFWQTEVGCSKPFIYGLGVKKLIKIVKSI